MKAYVTSPEPEVLLPLSQPSGLFLDVARIFATNIVVLGHILALYHFGPPETPLGATGVVTFFLLSGYLIFRTAWRRMSGPNPGFAPFMFDRIARIFTPFVPALLFAVAVNAVLPMANFGEPGINTGPLAFIGNLTLLDNFPVFQVVEHFFHSNAFRIRPYNTAEQFWTIPVEFWTYVFFGLFMFVLCRGERLPKLLVVALAAISAPVVIWNAMAGGGECLSIIWAMGAAFAWLTVTHKVGPRGIAMGAVAVGFGALGIAGQVLQHSFNPYDFQTAVYFGCLLFGGVIVLQAAPRAPKFLEKTIAFVANYSYSLYLVHNTILIVFLTQFGGRGGALTLPQNAELAFVTAHIVAIMFYWAFERHHKTVAALLKRRLAKRVGAAPVRSRLPA